MLAIEYGDAAHFHAGESSSAFYGALDLAREKLGHLVLTNYLIDVGNEIRGYFPTVYLDPYNLLMATVALRKNGDEILAYPYINPFEGKGKTGWAQISHVATLEANGHKKDHPYTSMYLLPGDQGLYYGSTYIPNEGSGVHDAIKSIVGERTKMVYISGLKI